MPDDSRRDDPPAEPIPNAESTVEPDRGSDATIDAVREEVARLRAELADIEDRAVDREAVESDLRRYVRRRMRRGRARGWGPYLVLLYGTAMTVGAFYYLAGGWAILAMIVVWLSTLGLYVVMVVVGTGLNALGIPRRLWDAIGERRR